jgi:SAM-dependent methyltransferase
MASDTSIRFFDTQFRHQVQAADLRLNPFEQRALPHLRGRVLDYGCGLGNLALAAARQGCEVLALEEGTTYLDMFDPSGHCLFTPDAVVQRFAGWDILSLAHEDFPAPGGRLKRFVTLIARKPANAGHHHIAVM